MFDNSKEAAPGEDVPPPVLVLEMNDGRLLYPGRDDAEALRATPEWAKPIVAAAFRCDEGEDALCDVGELAPDSHPCVCGCAPESPRGVIRPPCSKERLACRVCKRHVQSDTGSSNRSPLWTSEKNTTSHRTHLYQARDHMRDLARLRQSALHPPLNTKRTANAA